VSSQTFDPVPLIAQELNLPAAGVAAVVKLLAGGATVPFIARYRKEATGELDEVQIRAIEERRTYLTELEDRRQTVLASIEEQGKLTDELRARILACASKSELEDLYLPFRPKRRTRAVIAREKGLEPLALRILEQPAGGNPRQEAAAFVSAEKGVEDADAALAGARDIVAEAMSENPDVRALARQVFHDEGVIVAEAAPEAREQRTRFEQYYEFQEPAAKIPSHRYLAVRRGENEGVLRVRLDVSEDRVIPRIHRVMKLTPASPWAGEMAAAIEDGYRRLLAPSVSIDVRVDLKDRSDRAAVDVFASNLRDLLLAPPLGERRVVGIDPGLRTGCKCVALDETGKLLEYVTIFPGQGARQEERAKDDLVALVKRHQPFAVAVGNGTGGREAEAFARRVLREAGVEGVAVVAVSESGASVYSASDVAREELGDVDITVRGACSIARRLQDPLAELVKIDPKSIGVGQYQHDVHQPMLAKKLDEVVESCVNGVGVVLNTASPSLLGYVAGIGPTLAKRIVQFRQENGAFKSRKQLLQVQGIGPKTFEQAAGFLRIRDGEHPLDASAVHPERYKLVERMAQDLGVPLKQLVGDRALVERIDLRKYVSDEVGEPTLRDILDELRRPGRDPREQFEPPQFREDVTTLEDLKPGMILEGRVTNVTNFGAFVDIGVHEDGLVHISELSDKFVKDPREVVKTGDKIKVRVLSVDLERKRVSLSARSEGPRPPQGPRPDGPRRDGPPPGKGGPRRDGPPPRKEPPRPDASFRPFADLLKRRDK
jgi:uncharacterized protein